LRGDDPEVEGDSWGEGDSYHGDRVGGEGGGDRQGGRVTAQTTGLVTSGIMGLKKNMKSNYFGLTNIPLFQHSLPAGRQASFYGDSTETKVISDRTKKFN